MTRVCVALTLFILRLQLHSLGPCLALPPNHRPLHASPSPAPGQAFARPIAEVFSSVSERPVAAASLGQVYRATLRPELGGGEVAVKVQRPAVLEQVGLDLLIMRRAAVIMKDTLQV